MDYKKEWMQKISMHDYVKIDNDVYFSALNFNGLYRMRLSGRKLVWLGAVPGENLNQKHIYGAIAENAGKLYLAPRNGNEIAVYDLNTKVFEKIPLKYKAEGLPFKFSGVLSEGTKIYFIPARYRYLIILDVITGEMEYIEDWRKQLKVPDTYTGLLIGKGYFIKGKYLYMALMPANILVKMSLTTMEEVFIRIGEGKYGFADMCLDQDGESIWFIQKGRPAILKWNERLGEDTVHSVMPKGFTYGEVPFINVLDNGRKVIAIGYHANMSVEVDKSCGTIQQAKWDMAGTEGSFNEWHARHYFAKKTADSSFVVANIDDNSFYAIDGDELKEKFYLFDKYDEIESVYSKNNLLCENRDLGLHEFVRYISKGT